MEFFSFDSANSPHLSALVSIWNATCGDDLAINARLIAYNTRVATGARQAGQIAFENNRAVGFILASALPNDPQTSPPQFGWIDALAVAPEFQRRGIGSALIAWAEEWLRAQGCARFRLGGSLHPFAPGVPEELNAEKFFRARGYQARGANDAVWDVARDLMDYERATQFENASHVEIRSARVGDESALREFFLREFPGRWRFEFEEFLRARGTMSDYILLWTERGVDGFARVTFEDSERPIERFYMRRLSKPWGQLGPIGVSKSLRGHGFGGALMDAALRHLKSRGVRGCVIDWTDLIEFYRKFGFETFRQYRMLVKADDSQ
ncbi:MAG: GNAT family N-acetyltransferase [Chloroflexi bacterium]|nr:GNAT family N-acetyltransferase [Chloroflexota bacterium]